jgi:hypothetical protein
MYAGAGHGDSSTIYVISKLFVLYRQDYVKQYADIHQEVVANIDTRSLHFCYVSKASQEMLHVEGLVIVFHKSPEGYKSSKSYKLRTKRYRRDMGLFLLYRCIIEGCRASLFILARYYRLALFIARVEAVYSI